MATLASIPKSNNGLSQSINQANPRHRIPPFERLRSRSRVVFLSRRPTRARYSRKKARSESGSQQLSSNSTASDPTPLGNTKRAMSTNKEVKSRNDQTHNRHAPSGTISDPKGYENAYLGHSVPAANGTPFDVSPQSLGFLETTGSGHCDEMSSTANFDGQHGITSPTTPKHTPNLPQMYRPCETTVTEKHLQHPSHEPVCDATHGVTSPLRRSGVDNLLVETIARNVAQQLQMLSIRSEPRPDRQTPRDSDEQSPASYPNSSRTSSQRVALDRFTRELQRHAEHTRARGRLPIFTPTPTKSGATLHTVSALVPFRSEFKAAGLAVTSKDQATPHPRRTRTRAIRATRPPQLPKLSIKETHLSQLDGNDGCCPSSNTEISFTAPSNMDEWRYAMMDEAAPHRHRKPLISRAPKSKCLPCIPNYHESPERGCLRIPQKSQLRIHAPETVTRAPHVASDVTSKMAKLPAKASVPEWRRLPAPHIVYPHHHRQGPRTKVNHTAERVHRAGPGRERPTGASSGSRQSIPVTGLRRQSMTLPWQVVDARPFPSNCSIERSNLKRQRTRTVKVTSTPNARLPIAQLKEVNCQKPARHSPRRHQSVPNYDITKDLQKVKAYQKPLPNLPSTPNRDIGTAPSIESVAEPAIEIPAKGKGTEEAIKICQKTHGCQLEPHPAHQHITPRARGYSSQLPARPNIPQRMSSMKGSLHSANWEDCDDKIMDRDVLRGLHIAASAACDERVDALIRRKTGFQIRRFLVGLTPFENLGDTPLPKMNGQQARRKAEIRKVKQRVRRSREVRKSMMA
ncbi:hypothetical protein BKA56DRAFT_3688 [Ilyonectria sp. MPI-CAGE-AT-0026]|nr:hypothetical protein BKA56DRAFT_3688 [Ilyonectria sp. MPI-CAGE-AT-0026]